MFLALLVLTCVSDALEIPVGKALFIHVEGTASEPRIVRVKSGAHLRPPLGDDSTQAVIVVERAKYATIDLEGVDLRGTKAGTELDQDKGFGLVLRDCDHVTVKGGKLGGYKVCVAAFACKDLVLDGIQFDGWFGMHLMSTRAAEDGSDWLYPHHNDDGEWMKNYGGAIALNDCTGATIRGCKGRHGQNGILLTRTNGCTLHDDDFSFLSGWGLGLYRASKNVVSHCVFDYCVRGYSHDVYWRGQDSAGILMFERSSDNLFVHDSATHGGDGVFLFAGLDTVEGHAFDKGETDAGGADRNVWYDCDFSYAVANAIEATFSKDNWAIANRLDGSHQHGVWGGYSSRMVIARNSIERTIGGGVSIEHGQDCVIADNTFADDDMAVELWWSANKGLDEGPFGKHRDTSSRDTWVLRNRFSKTAQFPRNALDLVLTQTKGVVLHGNTFESREDAIAIEKLALEPGAAPDSSRSSASPRTSATDPKDLLVGEGGSRPTGRIRDASLRPYPGDDPEILKKALSWKPPQVPGSLETIEFDGVEIRGGENGHANVALPGTRGLDTIVMGEWGPWDFRSREPKPKQREPGGLLASSRWKATWFRWDDAGDPRKDVERWRKLVKTPLASAEVGAWVNPHGGDADVRKKVGNDHFGMIATTTLVIAKAGPHTLSVVSDDGVRVLVDGKSVVENWTWHAPTKNEAEIELAAGPHTFTVEYFQIDGALALTMDLVRVEKR
jgi:hypothetical protein